MLRTSSARGVSGGSLLVVAALVLCSTARAQEPAAIPSNPRYVFQAVGAEAGLSTRTPNSMLQDSSGFLWLATMEGVYRFDGAEFVLFAEEQGLPATYVHQIVEGPDGKIWASVAGRVAWFDGRRFVELDLGRQVSLTQTGLDVRQRLAIDARNVVYITNNREIVAVNGRRVALRRVWTKRDGLPSGEVRAIHAGVDGRVWFVAGRQVGYIDPVHERLRLIDSTGIPDDAVIAVFSDRDETLWVRTENYLVRRTVDSERFVHDDAGLAEPLSDGIPSLDREGNLLVPTRSGLFLREQGRWRAVTPRDGLPISAISSVLEDRDGALWIGLAGAGLVRWSWRSRFLGWTAEEGLPDDGVWGVLRDGFGRLWVGTNNGVGIWLPAERTWKLLEREDGLAGYSVWKFAVGQDGRVWSISRRAGLNRYDPETLEPEGVALPEEFGGNPWELEAGPDRSLWVGGKGYLLRIRAAESGPVFEEVELPRRVTGVIESVSFGSEGTVWVCGRDGLLRYDGRAWKQFGAADGLSSNRMMNVAAASADEVWVGYEEAEGVSRLVLDGGKPVVTHFRRQQGLLSDTVWMLERDPLGRIWVGGSDGVSAILPDGTVRSYDQGDGLIWNDIAQAGFWMDPDGSVFIGTSRGLAWHDPAADQAQESPPNVVITSATLGGEERLGEAGIEVGYGQGTFTARFSGLTFRNPSQVLFKYQLVGLETEPVVTKLREVRYPALGAGSYRFEVLCRSAAGVWTREPASIAFTVLPPWWERWWFRLGVVVAVVLLVVSILQLRTRRLAADRRRLEAAVAERSAQLAEANRELRELSFTDVLTRVRNRRFFAATIRDTVKTALRRHDPRTEGSPERNRDLVFFIVDLDHFKKVNDVHGHMVGDRVLVETARRLEAAVRESDLVVRWGGEEFLLVCRDTERAKAAAVAKRILDLVGGTPLVNELGLRIQRTCSAGWAALPAYLRHPEELSHEVVLEIADMALYLAKQSGRNQAVGVELNEDEFSRGRGLEWLEQSLVEVEGDLVRLNRVEGPRVSLDPITAVSPVTAPWRRKSKVPDEEGEG